MIHGPSPSLLLIFFHSLLYFIFWLLCLEVFLLWSRLFGVLWTSYMFMGTTLFRLGKFYSIILLKVFTSHLSFKALLFSISTILPCFFFFLLYTGFPGWFWLHTFYILNFLLLLCRCFLWYIQHIRFSLLPLVFSWCLHLWLLRSFQGFDVQICLHSWYLVVSTSVFISWMVLLSFFLLVCVSLPVIL